jgi:hypothetical protein
MLMNPPESTPSYFFQISKNPYVLPAPGSIIFRVGTIAGCQGPKTTAGSQVASFGKKTTMASPIN